MRLFIDSATFLLTGVSYSRWSAEWSIDYTRLFCFFIAFKMLVYFVFVVTGLGSN